MDKFLNIGMDKLITSIYDFGGLTTQEVWCKFAQKINIIIEHFNYLDTKFENEKENTKLKLDYLLGQGLSEKVAEQIMIKINDGTIKDLINNKLFNDLDETIKSKTQISIVDTIPELKKDNIVYFKKLGDGKIEVYDNKGNILYFKTLADIVYNENKNVSTVIKEMTSNISQNTLLCNELQSKQDEQYLELTEIISNGLGNIDKKLNKYFVLAPQPSGADDTLNIQKLIKSNTVILFPFSVEYSISTLNINNISNLTILGNNSTFKKNNTTNAIIDIQESENIDILNLQFDYSIPTDNSSISNSCVTLNNYAYIYFNKCTFKKFKDVAINIKTAKDSNGINGGTSSAPCVIEKCKFLNQQIIDNIEATSILLGNDAEYCKILFNEFRHVLSAIRGYGANSLIDGNTIMDSEGIFNVDTALIYLKASSDINSAKHIITNNEINHNNKGITAIYCIGDKTRNERRYTISNNHILIHGMEGLNNGYGIGIKNADGSLIEGNYIKVQSENKGNILIDNSLEVIVTNNTIQQSTGIRAVNSSFYERNNTFIECLRNVWLFENSKILDKTYTVRIKFDNADIGTESNWEYISCQKTSTGVYVLTHNLGHTDYIAVASPDNAVSFCSISLKRTTNTIEIRCFNQSGALKDENIMLIVHTK